MKRGASCHCFLCILKNAGYPKCAVKLCLPVLRLIFDVIPKTARVSLARSCEGAVGSAD